LSPQVQDKAQLPVGVDAARILREEAQRISLNQNVTTADGRAISEYRPQLLEEKMAGGAPVLDPITRLPELDNVVQLNREARDGDNNPYTGWGATATRNATDSAGNPLPTIDNQELKLSQRVPIPVDSQLTQVTPTGAENPIATFPLVPGTGTNPPQIVTTDPEYLREFWDHMNRLGRAPTWRRP